jgi:hypothetical protein
MQEPEREKSSVPGGESSERPEIRPENLDLHPTLTPNVGSPANRQGLSNRQVPQTDRSRAPSVEPLL